MWRQIGALMQESDMKRLGKLTRGKLVPGKLTLTVLAVALAAPALAGAVPVINSFDSVAHVEHVASYVSPQDLKDFAKAKERGRTCLGAGTRRPR